MASTFDKRALEAYNRLKAYCEKHNGICSGCLFYNRFFFPCIFEYEVCPRKCESLELEDRDEKV